MDAPARTSTARSPFVAAVLLSVVAVVTVSTFSLFLASIDDDTFLVLAENKTTIPPEFQCLRATVHAPDCTGRRRLHGHSAGHAAGGHAAGGHSSGGAAPTSVARTSPGSGVNRHSLAAGSIISVHLFLGRGHDSSTHSVRVEETLEFCGEVVEIVNRTLEFEGIFVATCSNDVITFWNVFGVAFAACCMATCFILQIRDRAAHHHSNSSRPSQN